MNFQNNCNYKYSEIYTVQSSTRINSSAVSLRKPRELQLQIMTNLLYVFFWVIPRRLNFICRRFGILCLFPLHRQVGVELPRRKHTTYRTRRKFEIKNDQLDAQIVNTFITILYMYMFRAISCSSSGGQIVLIQHLISSLSVRCTG